MHRIRKHLIGLPRQGHFLGGFLFGRDLIYLVLGALCTAEKKETETMKLYVGNLSYDTNDDSLRQAFSAVGPVATADVITDRDTGRSRGFGFVEMANTADAQKAIEELNDKPLDGRNVTVAEARPRRDSDNGGSRGRSSNRW